MTNVERFRQIRETLKMFAETITADSECLKIKSLYDEWKPNEEVKTGDKRIYNDILYKCVQGHTTQDNWTPDKTSAMWTAINETNAGTKDDPIPAQAGMEYEYGKYYLDPEDNKVYLCERIGAQAGEKIVLQFLPHSLVGQYFTLAE